MSKTAPAFYEFPITTVVRRVTIDQVAPLLYGPSWQTPLAKALGLTVRTVQRWAAGAGAPSHEHWAVIYSLLDIRLNDIKRALHAARKP